MESYIDFSESMINNEQLQLTGDSVSNGEKTLYELLFSEKDDSKNEPKTDVCLTKESLVYLQELNALHIDRLQLEPKLLLDKKEQINDEIQTLAFSNYKTFIRTAQCSREIYSDFSIIETKLDSLITNLPEFGTKCDNFTKLIQGLNTNRRSNNLTLQKHNQLLEILEISQLMDTCVRNEYYDEALDLANYVKRLEKKFASSIGVIKGIIDDVNESLNLMLKQLLAQLRTSLQFNQCLKVIGIIRRMDVFGESELRVRFLQLRDIWLQAILSNIPTTNPYNHISKTIEEMRVHLFDIITQYKAIFSDEDSLSNRDLNESKLFHCWLQQKIKIFLQTLKCDLKAGVGNRIDSILSQAMYFGLAFSRVGLDFRVLMIPIFEEAVLDQVQRQLHIAYFKFEDSLVKTNWSELGHDNSKSYVATAFKEELAKQKSNIVHAPICLLEFQPLAVYLNELLVCFNDLRLCAPLDIFAKVADLIRNSLSQLGTKIDEYFRKEKPAFDSKEMEAFDQFLYLLAYEMVPFVERCLMVIFPLNQLQSVLLVPENDLESLRAILKLNITSLFEASLLAIIPRREETKSAQEKNTDSLSITEAVADGDETATSQ